jgi:hypothetical protein
LQDGAKVQIGKPAAEKPAKDAGGKDEKGK